MLAGSLVKPFLFTYFHIDNRPQVGILARVLTPESRVLMTFATPYGRYRWICLPLSLSTLF